MQQRKLAKFLNRDLYYDANIRLRELTDGRFVYFPFAWREGGKGYFVAAEVAEKMRSKMWSPAMFFVAPVFLFMGITLMLTDFSPWWGSVAALISLLIGYGLHSGSRKMLLEQAAGWQAAPYQLTEAQYRLEFALQQSGFRVWTRLLFWVSLLVLMAVGLGNLDGRLLTIALYASIVGLVVHRLYATLNVVQLRRKGLADGVVIGGLEQLEKAD